jgi:hypothetical protein
VGCVFIPYQKDKTLSQLKGYLIPIVKLSQSGFRTDRSNVLPPQVSKGYIKSCVSFRLEYAYTKETSQNMEKGI